MGKLTDAVKADDSQRAGTFCTVGTVRARLDHELRADLDSLLADSKVTAASICRALKQFEHQVSQGAMQRHRRGDCTCGRAS